VQAPKADNTTYLASVDLDECIERLYNKELLAESVVEAICAKTKELLMKESNVVHIAAPVTVVGDIHGQFFDMIEIFRIGGKCPDTNYLFLGMIIAPRTKGRAKTDIRTQAIMSTEASSVLKRYPCWCA